MLIEESHRGWDPAYGGESAIYFSSDWVTFEPLDDSYANAGFSEATLRRSGVMFVGAPATAAYQQYCVEEGESGCASWYYEATDELVERHNRCTEDADCEHVHMDGADCVAGCGFALNTTLDLGEMERSLGGLSDGLRARCSFCAVPGCIQPTGAFCNAELRCETLLPE